MLTWIITGEPGTTTIVAYDLDSYHFATCKVTVKKGKSERARIAEARIKSVKVKGKALQGGKISLTWNKAKGVSGYRVYMATSKNGAYKKMATVKGAKNCSWTASNLKKGKRYYFIVRPFTKVGKKNYAGRKSAVVKVKTK